MLSARQLFNNSLISNSLGKSILIQSVNMERIMIKVRIVVLLMTQRKILWAKTSHKLLGEVPIFLS